MNHESKQLILQHSLFSLTNLPPSPNHDEIYQKVLPDSWTNLPNHA